MAKARFSRYKAFVEASAKAYSTLDRQAQILIAQKLWKKIKDDPEKHNKMMVEFRAKTASSKGKLLSFWGRVASSNSAPAANPVQLRIQSFQ